MVPGVEDDTEYLFIVMLSLRCKSLSKQARRKETPMLPLPLQLTRPIELATSLEASLKEAFEVESTRYNPETQVREDATGTPFIRRIFPTQAVSQSRFTTVPLKVK